MSDDWNNVVASQTIQPLWLKKSDAEEIRRQRHAAVDALIGITPRDEFEGIIAAQLLAAQQCCDGMLPARPDRQTDLEGRRENLNRANKLSRTYATLLEMLNRHRGKGQQKVTVEHVHVHAGGQAVVWGRQNTGGGDRAKPKVQPRAKQIAHAPQRAVWSADEEREPVPVAGDAERSRCRMHGDNRQALQGGIRTLKARPLRRRGDCEAS